MPDPAMFNWGSAIVGVGWSAARNASYEPELSERCESGVLKRDGAPRTLEDFFGISFQGGLNV